MCRSYRLRDPSSRQARLTKKVRVDLKLGLAAVMCRGVRCGCWRLGARKPGPPHEKVRYDLRGIVFDSRCFISGGLISYSSVRDWGTGQGHEKQHPYTPLTRSDRRPSGMITEKPAQEERPHERVYYVRGPHTKYKILYEEKKSHEA